MTDGDHNGKTLKELLLTLIAPPALRSTVKDYDPHWYDVPGISIAFNLGSRPAEPVQLARSRTSPDANATTFFEAQFGNCGLTSSSSSSSSSSSPLPPDAPRNAATTTTTTTTTGSVPVGNQSDGKILRDTLFQAASMSKCFLAIGICRLIDTGFISSVFDSITDHLDKDIVIVVKQMALNLVRKGTVPDVESAAALLSSIRISDLLSHTSSVNVDTFLGYTDGCLNGLEATTQSIDQRRGQVPALPCASTVVLGRKDQASDRVLQVRSPPILPEGLPGLTTKYSGGGCMILQLIVERYIDVPFEAWMQRLMQKLDMTTSLYGRPADELSVAMAHSNASVVIPGGYAVYAEQGAIGLWSTPSDLVRGLSSIARILQRGYASTSNTVPSLVSQSTLRQVLLLDHDGEDQNGSYSMGFRIHTFRRAKRVADRSKIMLSHRGRSLGYQSWAGVVVDLQDQTQLPVALAIMTNSEEGGYIRDALLSALSAWLDQPFDAACRFKPVVPLAELDEMRGEVGGNEGMVGDYVVQHSHVPTAIWTRTFVIAVDEGSGSDALTVQFPETLGELRMPLYRASHRGHDDKETLYRIGGLRTALCVKDPDEPDNKPTVSLMQDGQVLRCVRCEEV